MSGTGVPINGSNLRNRVVYTEVIDQENTDVPEWRAATFYSYDPHGNVDTLVQDYGPNSVMGQDTGNRFKTMTYDFDLISGKVNQVSYQPGLADGFYHQYSYDAENRITGVRSSTGFDPVGERCGVYVLPAWAAGKDADRKPAIAGDRLCLYVARLAEID